MVAQASVADGIRAARARYVPRGVAAPQLVVARAEGSWIEDADGRRLLDFAGGIACQNLGHGVAAVTAAIHEQVDRYLHQCFMVATYEPYVEVCRRLAEVSPCRGAEQKTLLLNSGAEAVENAVKIARAATGRDGVVVLDNAFHGRTLLTLAMTANVKYKHGFGSLPPSVFRAPGPYPYRGVSSADALAALERLFKTDVAADEVACIVIEPVQGEGGFIPMDGEYLSGIRELCDRHGMLLVDDEVQAGIGRTGRMWAVEHVGVEPDLVVAGKSLGGGLPLASVTGRAEVMDIPAPGGLGGTFGGNPASCAASCVVLDVLATPEFRQQAAALERALVAGLERIARHPAVGQHRGLGAMRALELVEPTPELASRVVANAYDRGLLLLACGTYGNVLRLLPPFCVTERELEQGLDILEEALAVAG